MGCLDLNLNPNNLDWIISFTSVLFLCCPKSYFKRIPVLGLIVEVSVFGLACHDLDYTSIFFFGGVYFEKGRKKEITTLGMG